MRYFIAAALLGVSIAARADAQFFSPTITIVVEPATATIYRLKVQDNSLVSFTMFLSTRVVLLTTLPYDAGILVNGEASGDSHAHHREARQRLVAALFGEDRQRAQ